MQAQPPAESWDPGSTAAQGGPHWSPSTGSGARWGCTCWRPGKGSNCHGGSEGPASRRERPPGPGSRQCLQRGTGLPCWTVRDQGASPWPHPAQPGPSVCRRLARSTLLLIPLLGIHYMVFAMLPTGTSSRHQLLLELCVGSFQVRARGHVPLSCPLAEGEMLTTFLPAGPGGGRSLLLSQQRRES